LVHVMTPRAKKIAALAIAYAVAIALLSSVDMSYSWYAPFSVEGGSVAWYDSFVLEGGALGARNHEYLRPGLAIAVHPPTFFPRPLLGLGGPEGGVAFVSLWFLGLIVWLVHVAVVSGQESARAHAFRSEAGVAVQPAVAADGASRRR
jgi:hypothetical protein